MVTYCKKVCKLCQMSVSDLKPTNKRPSDKEKDLIGGSFRRFITLLDDGLRMMLINAP